jgi:tRNA threonylcarbamoyladenosine biosynthesis protein TsaB
VSLVLAFETATALGSVAVGDPGRVREQIALPDRNHAALLLPISLDALRRVGATVRDVTDVVVSDGPGSFTGLRIGLATAKGILAANAGAMLHTAPSLLGAAWAVRRVAAGPIAPMYDALRGEVFAALYDLVSDAVRVLLPPTCDTIEAIQAAARIRPAVAVGDGASANAAIIRRWTGRDPIGFPEGAPRAGALIELLGVPGAVRHIPDPDRFEPDYGRRAAAEDRWEAAHGRSLPRS